MKMLEAKMEAVFFFSVMGIFGGAIFLIWLFKVFYYLFLGAKQWVEGLPAIDKIIELLELLGG